MDKEFLQYIKETEYYDLLDIDEKDIPRFKDTYNYQIEFGTERCVWFPFSEVRPA